MRPVVNGRATFAALEPGSWKVERSWSVTGPGFVSYRRLPRAWFVRIEEDSTASVSVGCGPVVVSGHVTLAGAPLPDARFEFVPAGDPAGFPFRTDGAGAFTVRVDAPGPYRAIAVDAGEALEGSCLAGVGPCELAMQARIAP